MRPLGTGLLAISQPDHAQMAGVFAEAWAARMPEALVVASHHHDDGWWEQSPTVDRYGQPLDFLTYPMEAKVVTYHQSISALSEIDLTAALLTSMHFSRLVAGALDSLKGDDIRLGEVFVANQLAWEIHARAALGEPRDLEAAYQVLRAVDYLSLVLCMCPPDELAGTALPPVRFSGENSARSIRLEVLDPASGRVLLDPYPFARAPLAVGVNGRALESRTFVSAETYRAALASAPVQPLRFSMVPAHTR